MKDLHKKAEESLKTSNSLLVDPYKYSSDLYQEGIDDEMLNIITSMGLYYMRYSMEEFLEIYSPENVLEAVEFTTTKYDDLSKIQESLKIANVGNPFRQIGHSLDLVTLQTELKPLDSRSIFYGLGSQLTATKEILALNSMILTHALKELNKL